MGRDDSDSERTQLSEDKRTHIIHHIQMVKQRYSKRIVRGHELQETVVVEAAEHVLENNLHDGLAYEVARLQLNLHKLRSEIPIQQ